LDQHVPVLIIDPGVLFREGLRRILRETGHHAAWCDEFPPIGLVQGLPERSAPLLIIGTDIEEAGLHIAEVKRLYPDTRVLLLIDNADQSQFVAAVRCGAEAVVLRSASCETFIASLRLVMNGLAIFPAGMIEALVDAPVSPPIAVQSVTPPSLKMDVQTLPYGAALGIGFSGREREVLEELLVGHSNKEIARALGITEATVKVHVKAILRKAQVRNRTQVAIWASQRGFGSFPALLPATMTEEPQPLTAA